MEGADERSATILARKPLELNRELNPPYAGHRGAAETKYRAADGPDSSEAAIRCFNSRYTKFASRGCGRRSPVVIRGAPPELGFTRVRHYRLSRSATADLEGASPESMTTIGSMDSGLATPEQN